MEKSYRIVPVPGENPVIVSGYLQSTAKTPTFYPHRN